MSKADEPFPEFRGPGELESYLTKAFEGSNPERMLEAIGVGARAFGVTELSQITGLRRENFYRKLSAAGNPGFKDVIRILSVLGFEVSLRPRRRWSHHAHSDLGRIVAEIEAEGVTSIRGLALALTERGVPTAQGFRAWSPAQVTRVLARLRRASGRD